MTQNIYIKTKSKKKVDKIIVPSLDSFMFEDIKIKNFLFATMF